MVYLGPQSFGELTDPLVFVGGCATGLLVTRMRANQIRATEDVDVLTQAATIAEYHGVESMLASRGFKHDTSPDAPICRWLRGGMTLDLMPSQPGVLSFHTRWYPLAVTTASPMTLPSGHSIKLITAPVFVATKLEAFKGRGNGDYLVSHDLEDIVTVVDGRPALIDELRDAPEELRTDIAKEISSLLGAPQFLDALPGHLPGDSASQSRLRRPQAPDLPHRRSAQPARALAEANRQRENMYEPHPRWTVLGSFGVSLGRDRTD